MHENRKRNNFKKIMRAPGVLLVVIVFSIILIGSTVSMASKSLETSKRKNLAEQEIKELALQKSELEREINNLQTEEGQEKIIRDKFRVTKDGEELVVVVDDKKDSIPTSNDSKFIQFFKNIFKR